MSSLGKINIRFAADLKGFSSQMQNVSRSLQKTSKQMQNLGAALSVGVTAPLTGLGVVAVKTFADFEQSMAKVKAISGATATQFEALTANAKKLGETTRFTASEVSALQLNYSKLGFNPDEILKATAATLNLSLATGEDLAQSTVVAASTLRGFGLSADETGRIVDVMAKSFSSSALDLSKFETAMSVLAPVAKNANVSLEQATGMLSVLVNAGIDASTAGTGLRNIFLDLAGNGLSLEEALGSIAGATNKNAAAFDLFGKRGATVAAVLADNYTEAQQLSEAYINAGGSAAAMAAIMDNTLQGSFFRLKSAFEGAAISLGEALAPTVRKLAEYVTSAVSAFNELSPETKKFIVILGGIAAAIGPLLALAGTILPALATGFALLTGPIGLIIAGLTAVGVIIYKNWKPIKKTLIDIANYFVDLYNESTAFRVGVEAVALQFKAMYKVAVFVFDALSSIVTYFVDSFKNQFKSLGKIFKGALTFDYELIKEGLSDAFTGAGNSIKDLVSNLQGDFAKLSTGLETDLTKAIDNVTTRKKVKFTAENVETEVIEDAVSGAVQKGLAGGLSGKAIDTSKYTVPTQSFLDEAESENIAPDFAGLDEMFPNHKEAWEEFLGDSENGISQWEAQMEHMKEIGQAVGGSVAGAFDSFAGSFVDSLGLASTGLEGFVKIMAQTVTKLISMMLSQAIAQSIGNATSAAGATGPAAIFTQPAFIATLVGGVLSAFAAIPKFATGGIVGGSSMYGDKILARVNSGELILNQAQQKSMYGQLQGNNQPVVLGGGFEIKGDTLQLVLDRATNKRNRRS